MRFDSLEMGNNLTEVVSIRDRGRRRPWLNSPLLSGRRCAAGRFEAEELERRLRPGASRWHDALDGLPPLRPAPARRRWGARHGESRSVEPTWVLTKERFVDPSTQRVMRVWVDPADHARHYVPD